MNPQLAAYLIEMLLNHFQQYYEPDANILPPLKLAKCTSVRGAESVLQEPIGNLILVMQMIYVQATSEDSSEILKLGFLLESLCNRMAKSKLEHFELVLSDPRAVLRRVSKPLLSNPGRRHRHIRQRS